MYQKLFFLILVLSYYSCSSTKGVYFSGSKSYYVRELILVDSLYSLDVIEPITDNFYTQLGYFSKKRKSITLSPKICVWKKKNGLNEVKIKTFNKISLKENFLNPDIDSCDVSVQWLNESFPLTRLFVFNPGYNYSIYLDKGEVVELVLKKDRFLYPTD